MSELRTLDWVSRHDPESLRYPVRSVIGETVARVYKLWAVGPTLDQGREGACVGHGWTNEATAEPVPIDFARQQLGADDQGAPWPTDAQAFAFALYFWCRRNDEWSGEDYDGTSVLAGAAGMKRLGLIPEYRWAFSVEDLIDALVTLGVVVLGMDWFEGMYEAPGGELRVTGQHVGGHCILAVGYDPAHEWSDGTVSEAVALFNSWGDSFGINGLAWIRVEELAVVLAKNGEACVPMLRVDPAGPIPEPEPVQPYNPDLITALFSRFLRWLAGFLR